MKRLAALTAAFLLFAATAATAATPVFTASQRLTAGQPASITVDNTAVTWKTFIVMPGPDFTPSNGACYTNMRLSNGNAPRNVWVCNNRSAPIVFTTASVTAADLVADSSHTWPTGQVGLVGTGGWSRGAWTLSVPLAEYDFQAASTL